MTQKTKIEWKIEKRKVKDLVPAEYNPRKMTEQERRDLEDSIKEFGAVVPVVVNVGKRKDTLIGGHQRITIYADLKVEDVDVMVPSRELTMAEEKKLNLRLNKNTGSWDFEKLKEMDLNVLLDVGFGDEDLSTLWDDVDVIDDGFDVAKAIKEIKVPKTKTGDVYKLGDHRLMCGDSTKPEDVAKLMGKDRADIIYCDPPYNIGLDYNQGAANGPKQKIKKMYREAGTAYKKDSKKDEDYASFIDATLKCAINHVRPNAHVFYWCDERYIWLLQTIFRDNKINTKRVCLWIKNNFSLTPQVAFNKAYEPCVYGIMGAPKLNKAYKNLNEILNKEVGSGNQVHDEIMDIITLWLEKRDNAQSYEHPTQKPVTLNEKPLKRCSNPGDIIIDLFGGSGSTLVACEQIKRQARLMEQDPVFCDVIIRRWEELTNETAKKK